MTEPQAKIRKLTATVELFKRTEETLIIKRGGEDDLLMPPVRLPVNKKVGIPIKIMRILSAQLPLIFIPGIGRLLALLQSNLLRPIQRSDDFRPLCYH